MIWRAQTITDLARMGRCSPFNNIDLCLLLAIYQHDSLSFFLAQIKTQEVLSMGNGQWPRLAQQDRRRGDASPMVIRSRDTYYAEKMTEQ